MEVITVLAVLSLIALWLLKGISHDYRTKKRNTK